METDSTQTSNTQLPPLGAQAQSVPAQVASAGSAMPPQYSGADTSDPKQMVAQYTALAEQIIARTTNSPRARADELAALKAQYIQARYGVTIQASAT